VKFVRRVLAFSETTSSPLKDSIQLPLNFNSETALQVERNRFGERVSVTAPLFCNVSPTSRPPTSNKLIQL
jgi:hypothetical protein